MVSQQNSRKIGLNEYNPLKYYCAIFHMRRVRPREFIITYVSKKMGKIFFSNVSTYPRTPYYLRNPRVSTGTKILWIEIGYYLKRAKRTCLTQDDTQIPRLIHAPFEFSVGFFCSARAIKILLPVSKMFCDCYRKEQPCRQEPVVFLLRI